MTNPLLPTDHSELEDRLRDALGQRATSTPITNTSLERVDPLNRRRARPRRHRRYLVATGAVAAGVALITLLTYAPPSADVGTVAAPVAPDERAGSGLPVAEVPRLLIAGADLTLSEGEGASPVQEDPTKVLQTFRHGGPVEGPMIFLTTLRPYDPATFGLLGENNGDPIDVRGQEGYIGHYNGPQGATSLSVELGDGNAVYVVAIGLSDDEIVSFLDGLAPGPAGRWVATTAPQGLSEVTVAPLPTDGRYYGGRTELPGLASVDINLYQDGFESRLQDRVGSTIRPVEAVSIDGLPATLGAYADGDWWVLLEPEPGRAVELRITGDRTAVDQVIGLARFVDEPTWDAAAHDS